MSFRNSLLVAACLLAGASAALAEEQTTQEQPIKVSAHAKAACMPDALRFCRDAVPNVRNVLMCFGQHREEISNRCRTVLASYGLQ
jgi:hypothetical protein